MQPFHNAVFVKSVAALNDLPASSGEVVFAGRSNAGKSSAINALVGRRIAFVSKTPGRTQLINFYALGGTCFLVDLPGYGYAKIPESVRSQWDEFLGGYLRTRDPLRGTVVVMDVRHPLTELDRRMLAWMQPAGRPVHILLTKADKLSRSEAQKVLVRVKAELALIAANISVQLFSALRRLGLEEAESVFSRWLAGPVPEAESALASGPEADLPHSPQA